MANGFDDLIEQLLYDVALTGSQGTVADLFSLKICNSNALDGHFVFGLRD